MSEFTPITHAAEMALVDEFEYDAGYAAGLHGAPEPLQSTVSRSAWNGWRAGHCEGTGAELDAAMRQLLHSYVVAGGRDPQHDDAGTLSLTFRLQ